MTSKSNLYFDENRWIIQIRRSLEDELEDDIDDILVSIFCVPKNLMVSNPDFYVPQQLSIGPYHHWRSELCDMDKYKLAAAKRIQKKLQICNFQSIVDKLSMFEPRIRAVYHKYLDFNSETLMWMMAVDASFLLQFLQIYDANDIAKESGKILSRIPSRLSHLVDIAGRKSAHNAILRDIIMVENQIPLFLLRKMLELQFSSLEIADNRLCSMLLGFCKEVSPFKNIFEEDICNITTAQMIECAHLIDCLYDMIIPPKSDNTTLSEITYQNEVEEEEEEKLQETTKRLKGYPIHLIKRIVFSRPVKFILKFPWTIISNLPIVSIIKQPIEYLCFNDDNKQVEKKSESLSNKAPLMEEIAIPSVTELANAGVRFLPAKEGVLSISFDDKDGIFYLPPISLDVNTEVVLRNLVAFEACNCNASRFLVFTRYTEMMNGIIDTEDDAKFLREKGIILNHLKSDLEVANLWNGMSRSIRLTKVPFLDKVIEDVNKYYNGKWKVKIGKFLRLYVFESWQLLTFLAAVLLLLLMALQAFCSVYSCKKRKFHVK